MTAELTFTPGHVPGITRPTRAVSAKPHVRRAPAHAAAPVSTPRDLLPGMSLTQKHALAALVHTPAGAEDLRYGASRRGASVAWIAVVACALAWTMAIAAELAPDLHLVRGPAVVRVAQPHVGETSV